MAKVLYIQSDVKPAQASRSTTIAHAFIDAYKKENPNDEITTLNLYELGIEFILLEDLPAMFGPKDEMSAQHAKLKYAYQFAEADKIIISTPMWNLSIPAILKAYIDYVSISGITFKYTENGPIGLLQNKKALIVSARGGHYHGTEMEAFQHEENYLKAILGFFGITYIQVIRAEGLDMIGANIDEIVESSIQEANQIAKSF